MNAGETEIEWPKPGDPPVTFDKNMIGDMIDPMTLPPEQAKAILGEEVYEMLKKAKPFAKGFYQIVSVGEKK